MSALEGVRVLELGQLIAGPFAGALLANHGAQVIKVEPLGGDPLRTWRLLENGTSLWWKSLSRNKRCVAIDLKTEEGQALIRRLCGQVDVLIENFKPGTLEAWNLAPQTLRAQSPDLIISRVSGFGQTGPYAHRPGYASVCEAMGGLRYINGFEGAPPVRPNLSLGDSLAGMHAAFAIMMALFQRGQLGGGQTLDISIAESCFNMLESVLPEYDRLGEIRGPSGSSLTGVAPTGTYRTRDERWLSIGANGERLFAKLCEAMEKPQLHRDPRYADNPARVANRRTLEAHIEAWVSDHDLDWLCARLESFGVPFGPVYTAKDIAEDPHFAARELFVSPESGEGGPLPALLPRLERSSGEVRFEGPDLGAHTIEVLKEQLGLKTEELDALIGAGIIVAKR